MHPQKANRTPSDKAMKGIGIGHKLAHPKTDRYIKSAGQVQGDRQARGKNTAGYWQDRIFKDVTRGVESPHYSMQVAFKGRRMTFTTGTGNKEAAARSAAGIYNDLLALGVEGALAKHRPQKTPKDKISTIGEWISAAKEVSSANDATFTAYARAHSTIAGGKTSLNKSNKRYGPKKGGSSKYREGIDSLGLEVFSQEAIH
jgi:hypothetical protein